MNLDRLSNIMDRLAREISDYNSTLLTKFPINAYLDNIANYPEIGSYHYVSPKIVGRCNKIVESSNEQVLELYHQLVLFALISKAKDKLKSMDLPEDVKALYNVNFERIIRNVESNNGCYTYLDDRFCKDIATCALRLAPVGPRKIHLASIPKVFLFKGGLRQFTNGVVTILELGGFSPFYEMHTDSKDPDSMAEFNYDGFIKSYIRIAKILKKEERVKGIFGVSWLYDPQLAQVSPRHNYIRELAIETGAKFFYMGTTDQVIRNATLKSPTRRRLYEEGKYIPACYFGVWSRQRLIDWANKQNVELCAVNRHH